MPVAIRPGVHLQARSTTAEPQVDVWEPSDFPAQAPEEYLLSHVQYQHFKSVFIGKPVQKCWVTAEQLESQGCHSWKEYVLLLSLANYG